MKTSSPSKKTLSRFSFAFLLAAGLAVTLTACGRGSIADGDCPFTIPKASMPSAAPWKFLKIERKRIRRRFKSHMPF